MKNQFKKLLFRLSLFSIGLIIYSCEHESLENPYQENTIDQQGEFIEIELNGFPVTVKKVGKKYLLGDDIEVYVDEVGTNKSVGRANGRWSNNTVIYAFDTGFSRRTDVELAMKHWELFTNVTFVERTFTNYSELGGAVLIYEGTGCSATIGYYGENVEHSMSIGSGCDIEIIIHEIGHVVGLWHEQSRSDRDQYITVNFDNVAEGAVPNFQTYVELGLDGNEYTDFDFNSVMLYGSYIFSANGQPTITKLNGSTFSRQETYLSSLDVKGLEAMYPMIGVGKKISISKAGTYVSSENGSKNITLTRDSVGAWEEFEVIPYGDGYVYLKGDNGKYLSEGDDHYLTFDKNQQSAATRFRLERLDGSYGIRSQKSGLYFAKESGTDKIICSETYMNGSSTFTIELIELSNTPVSGMITIKGNNQKYVSSEYGRKPMNCNRDNIGDWEQFEVVDAGAGLIALKGINGKYVSSENGREAITCRRSSIGSWEKFTLISTGGNSYAIKGSNGRYLSSENGSEEMTCSRIDIGAWEEFTITNL